MRIPPRSEAPAWQGLLNEAGNFRNKATHQEVETTFISERIVLRKGADHQDHTSGFEVHMQAALLAAVCLPGVKFPVGRTYANRLGWSHLARCPENVSST